MRLRCVQSGASESLARCSVLCRMMPHAPTHRRGRTKLERIGCQSAVRILDSYRGWGVHILIIAYLGLAYLPLPTCVAFTSQGHCCLRLWYIDCMGTSSVVASFRVEQFIDGAMHPDTPHFWWISWEGYTFETGQGISSWDCSQGNAPSICGLCHWGVSVCIAPSIDCSTRKDAGNGARTHTIYEVYHKRKQHRLV